MTITPEELKQIVKAAVMETLNEKKEKPVVMKRYTRQETRELLHISLSTLDTYVKKGAITCSRVGKRVLFSQEDIDKALAKNRSN